MLLGVKRGWDDYGVAVFLWLKFEMGLQSERCSAGLSQGSAGGDRLRHRAVLEEEQARGPTLLFPLTPPPFRPQSLISSLGPQTRQAPSDPI